MATKPRTAHGKLAQDLGLSPIHPMRHIQVLGGTERLGKMSPEARALMIGLAKKNSIREVEARNARKKTA